MQRKQENGINWLTFDLLSDFPKVKHGVFLRSGGYSVGEFSSLNLSDQIGDDPLNVKRNRQKVLEILQISNYSWMRQCHGKDVVEASCSEPLRCDGIFTGAAGIGLMALHADCQAAIFYDPIHHVAANVHCGWKGNVQNIYEATVTKLRETFGTDPADLIVCISPSLGPHSAEFVNYKAEFPESLWKFKDVGNNFDLWELSRAQLRDAGVLEGHIEFARMDTYENSRDFFSYRREKVTGRNGTVVALM